MKCINSSIYHRTINVCSMTLISTGLNLDVSEYDSYCVRTRPPRYGPDTLNRAAVVRADASFSGALLGWYIRAHQPDGTFVLHWSELNYTYGIILSSLIRLCSQMFCAE